MLVDLGEGDLGYWQAFWTLARSRTMGGGMAAVPNPLAYSEIVSYARTMRLPREETVTVVQMMDAVWLDHIAQQTKAAAARRRTSTATDQRPRRRNEP